MSVGLIAPVTLDLANVHVLSALRCPSYQPLVASGLPRPATPLPEQVVPPLDRSPVASQSSAPRYASAPVVSAASGAVISCQAPLPSVVRGLRKTPPAAPPVNT